MVYDSNVVVTPLGEPTTGVADVKTAPATPQFDAQYSTKYPETVFPVT